MDMDMKTSPTSSRGRARACESTRGGRFAARSLDFMHAGPSTSQPHARTPSLPGSIPPPPPPLFSELQPTLSTLKSRAKHLKNVYKAMVADRKRATKFAAEKKRNLAVKQTEKQVSRYLLPDAPPPKRQNRKASPERVSCPLLPGVPKTPPPRKPQPWETRRDLETRCSPVSPLRSGLSTSGPTRFEAASDGHTSTRTTDTTDTKSREITPYIFSPWEGINSAVSCPKDQLVDCEIELIGFTPTSSIDSPPLQHSTASLLLDISGDTAVFTGMSDPGSEIEPEKKEHVACTHIWGGAIYFEDLPVEQVLILNDIDARDNLTLREVASDPAMLNFEWSSDPGKFVGKQETFTGVAGPTFSVDGLSPLDVFRKIWDLDFINVIVTETNRYGQQKFSRLNQLWTNIDASDIWVFFALLMLQSILILPVEREYWYPCLALLKVGNFQKIMPYEKFVRIKKCLHFVDNTTLSATGENRKLRKIWPVLEHLNDKFSSLYLPEQHIAIDESLLLWKGRLSFVQKIATKAARVGIKSYELCESRTGYLWQMRVYTGKGEKSQPANTEEHSFEPEGATSKIVYDLVGPLLYKGHTLVMDNFYNSPLLSRTLKVRKTDTMGTLRLNREFVPESLRHLTKANIRMGEVVYSQTEDLTIAVWHDCNIVALISTYHKPAVGGKEKFGTYKYKPEVVLDYNMNMGGVDKKDQMLKAFSVERMRNQVWYKKFFRRLLNVSIYNAFVIYNYGKSGRQRGFRVTLAGEILKKFFSNIDIPKCRKLSSGHFPMKNTTTKKARCKFCALKKIDTRTIYLCDTCNVSLCIIGCFKDYHLKMGLNDSQSISCCNSAKA